MRLEPTKYAVMDIGPPELGLSIELRLSKTGKQWAVTDSFRHCLAKDGWWEYEPQPSSRDDEFLARCRWTSVQEALSFLEDHLAKYPDGFRPEMER